MSLTLVIVLIAGPLVAAGIIALWRSSRGNAQGLDDDSEAEENDRREILVGPGGG